MKQLARTATGEPLIGDEGGFVPLSSVDPSLETIDDALALAPDELPDPQDSSPDRMDPETIDFGTPLAEPGQLWGIGLNYTAHADDLDETRPSAPASFLQPPGVVTGPGGPIRLPPISVTDRPTAEAELGVVIGKRCRDVAVDEADSVIAGYLPVIEGTGEDIILENPRFLTASKRFDTFLVLGETIVCPTESERSTLDNWTIRTLRDGDVFAENQVGNARFSPQEIVSSLSQSTTIDAGSIISTGTPGAAPITPEHEVTAEIEPIGSVDSSVVR